MFTGAMGCAGSFLRQCVGVKEEIFIIHVLWILLWGREDLQLSPKEGTEMGPGFPYFDNQGSGAAPPTNLIWKHARQQLPRAQAPPTANYVGPGHAHKLV